MSEKNEKLNNLMELSTEKMGLIADADIVVGKPITTASGFQVIPFSKVTLGSVTGGGEYGKAKQVKQMGEIPFAGGSSAAISMKPMGFIIDDGTSCRILRIADAPLDNLIERLGEILQDAFPKKNEE